jgi:hypothetical protein
MVHFYFCRTNLGVALPGIGAELPASNQHSFPATGRVNSLSNAAPFGLLPDLSQD